MCRVLIYEEVRRTYRCKPCHRRSTSSRAANCSGLARCVALCKSNECPGDSGFPLRVAK